MLIRPTCGMGSVSKAAADDAQTFEQFAGSPAFEREAAREKRSRPGENTKAAIEQKIVETISPLPYVQSLRYIEERDGWILAVRHNNESTGNAVRELVQKIIQVEDLFECYLEPHISHVSSEPYDTEYDKLLFERRKK